MTPPKTPQPVHLQATRFSRRTSTYSYNKLKRLSAQHAAQEFESPPIRPQVRSSECFQMQPLGLTSSTPESLPADGSPIESSRSPHSSKSSVSTLDPSSPSCIILYPWTGANPKHVEKYADRYRTMYPSAILEIVYTALPDLVYRSSSKKQRRLASIIDRVHNQQHATVLIHCFSDGGANKAVEFAEGYFRRTGSKLPCKALILDSAPGHPRFFNYITAWRKTLPRNKIIRIVGVFLGYISLGIFWGMGLTFKSPTDNLTEKTRVRFEDDKYWNTQAPRCYMYSLADEMIWWEDIKEHAEEASRLGTPVKCLAFRSSGHCAHVKEDANKYWSGIAETWHLGEKTNSLTTEK